MPIEIRELIIRAVASENEDIAEESEITIPPEVREDIVQECIRQVLKILEKQKER